MNTLPTAATAEHLTEVLRTSDALPRGRVSNVALTGSSKKLRSLTHRLRLDYDSPVADAPHSVILKMGHLDGTGRPSYANQKEIAFYREIAPALPAGLVPRCFEAVEVTDTNAWHLLLEDLTDSHFVATEWPLPPPFEQCQSMMQALASIHAQWWDHPRLGVSVGNWRDAAAWDQILRSSVDQFTRFTDRFGEMVPTERRYLYERLFERAKLTQAL